jgi:hypothetical protein
VLLFQQLVPYRKKVTNIKFIEKINNIQDIKTGIGKLQFPTYNRAGFQASRGISETAG